MKTTVFLGGGRITSALIAGLRLANFRGPIIVHDRHPGKLRELRRLYGVRTEAALHRAVEAADLLIIAVRPSSVHLLLNKIESARIRHQITAVSLAAGIPLAILQSIVGSPVGWARAMPSPVCRVGQGLTALAFGRGVSAPSRRKVRDLFALVGDVVEIPEKRFDAFTVTFSSSHGYHTLARLIEAGCAVGLDHKTAQLAAAHALADAISCWRTSKLSLSDLLEEAATPGGIAAAVMESLDHAGCQKMLTSALRRGMMRARKNSVSFPRRKSV